MRWGFNTHTYDWTQYDIAMNISNRPSWGAHAEIPERGLAFYLNGQINNMSSYQDHYDNTAPNTLQGMVVLDLLHHKVSIIIDSIHIYRVISVALNSAGHEHIHQDFERWETTCSKWHGFHTSYWNHGYLDFSGRSLRGRTGSDTRYARPMHILPTFPL